MAAVTARTVRQAVSAVSLPTPCRGRPELYEYASLPGRRWIERRAVAQRLCQGCPLLGAPCARRALAEDAPGGMVWSGVPVPDRNRIGDYRRALLLLEEMADHE